MWRKFLQNWIGKPKVVRIHSQVRKPLQHRGIYDYRDYAARRYRSLFQREDDWNGEGRKGA